MNKVLKHCFPDRKLDLPELRNVLSQLESKSSDGSEAISLPVLSPPGSESIRSSISHQPETADAQTQEGVVFEEIASLHKDLGCMMRDSSGEYRKSNALQDAGGS